MKKIFFTALTAVSLTACGQKAAPTYTINGTAEGADGQTVYIISGQDTIGQTIIADGKFTFTAPVEEGKLAAYAMVNRQLVSQFYLEEGSIEANLNDHSATGTPLNDANMSLSNRISELMQLIQAPNANQDSIANVYQQAIIDAAGSHVGDAFGLELTQMLTQEMTIAEIDSVMALCPLYANDPQILATRKIKEVEEQTSAGHPFVEIEGVNATTSEAMKLSDVVAQGKPVVVDFWASWCGPCRREIKEYLSKFAEKYKGKVNFVGIAVWEKGIADTQGAMGELPISWPVIYTGEDASKNVTDAYGIQGIPQIMVIGADGKILGRNLRGEAISELLDTVVK